MNKLNAAGAVQAGAVAACAVAAGAVSVGAAGATGAGAAVGSAGAAGVGAAGAGAAGAVGVAGQDTMTRPHSALYAWLAHLNNHLLDSAKKQLASHLRHTRQLKVSGPFRGQFSEQVLADPGKSYSGFAE